MSLEQEFLRVVGQSSGWIRTSDVAREAGWVEELEPFLRKYATSLAVGVAVRLDALGKVKLRQDGPGAAFLVRLPYNRG